MEYKLHFLKVKIKNFFCKKFFKVFSFSLLCGGFDKGNSNKTWAQVNFSGPWENIQTLWQSLLLPLKKTLPNLTLPN